MTRSRKAKAALILTLAALTLASANAAPQTANASQKSCTAKIQEAVRALSTDTQGTLITDREREQIQKIFEDPQKRSSAAAYVFDLLMEKRLALIPPQDAAQIRKIIQTVETRPTSGLDAWSHRKHRSITILIPQTYHGSIVEFYIKTHEVEHAIQFLAEARSIGKTSLNYFQRMLTSFDAKLRFIEEAGAMQAEWQYLQALPAETKSSIVQDIRKNTQLNDGEKAFLIRVFSSDAWKAGDHVLSEWDAGRYLLPEMESITRREKMNYGVRALLATGTVTAGTLATVLGVEVFCQKELNQSLMPPDGAFYQKICSRFKNIQEQQAARFPASLPTEN